MYVTLLQKYIFRQIVSGMKRRNPKESRAPYAHLAGYIQNNMVFIAAILIIAKILHAVLMLGASNSAIYRTHTYLYVLQRFFVYPPCLV